METEKINETIKTLSKYVKKDFAKLIEKSINDFSVEYSEINEIPFLLESIYDTKVEEILYALYKNKDIITTEDEAKRSAYMKPEELNPEKYEKVLKRKEMEEYKKNDIKSSTAFKCSKCKKSKCSVTQKQTRAGDEPATTFVTCLECGYNFSFN